MPDNKVKYNLKNAHYALLTFDADGAPVFGTPVPMPGSVSISLDANGEPENFYADGIAYYVINNNMGYDGDLELALIPESFRTDILREELDSKGVLVENSNSELGAFALLFEFDGDQKHIRHILYNCSASRPSIEGKTNEESKEVQTETITIKATPLPDGIIKAKTGNSTDSATYAAWYSSVYIPVQTIKVTPPALALAKGETGTASISNASGTVTATVEKVGGGTATGVTATISGSTVRVVTTSSAATGTYTVTLSDAGTSPATTAVLTVTVEEA